MFFFPSLGLIGYAGGVIFFSFFFSLFSVSGSGDLFYFISFLFSFLHEGARNGGPDGTVYQKSPFVVDSSSLG